MLFSQISQNRKTFLEHLLITPECFLSNFINTQICIEEDEKSKIKIKNFIRLNRVK